MDIYTLTPGFLDNAVIDEFVSAIWSERYSTAGDVQLVVPPTDQNVERLIEGTLLALRGSKEVMIVDSAKIEQGLLTVVGSSLVEFLNQRWLWAENPDTTGIADRVGDYSDDTKTPGQFISDLVYRWAISPTEFTGTWADVNLDWPLEVIPNLTLGDIDNTGTVQRLTAPIGPLYDAIGQLASNYAVGISLYLESADADGYSLKFKTYAGLDRTSGQTENELVRLSQKLDTLSDVTEIRSNVSYKNVVYVMYKGIISKHLADPDLPEPVGLDRRVLVTDAVGNPVGHKVSYGSIYGTNVFFNPSAPGFYYPEYTKTEVSPEEEAAFREQNAKDALANNNYIRSVDGTASPISDYQYGRHYNLGDIIELESLSGVISKAQVTEFIRSQDNTGEKSYPTISVVA